MNTGVITALFATYCIFVSIEMRIIFNEKLKFKFFLGIGAMLICVGFISFSALAGHHGGGALNKNAAYALIFGISAPLMISIMITLSRWWTEKYGYVSLDFTIDTFLLLSLAEIGFFYYFA